MFLFAETAYSQKVVVANGKGEVEFSSTLSETDAKRSAKEQATVAALEAAFGTVLINGSATYISNTVTGEKTESKSVYNFISNTAVNGEVLVVKEETYRPYLKPIILGKDTLKVRFMECSVTILAKELVAPPIQFDTYPLGCENSKCKTFEFKNNEDFFFYFSCPISGYLWIYLDDGTQAQCLLPYSEMPSKYESGFPVTADKEYIFFSNSVKNHNLENLDFSIDTYQLSTEKDFELNRVFVVFSEKPLTKAKLSNNEQSRNLSETELRSGYSAPKSMASEDFQKWLIKNRSYKNTQISLKTLDITINRK